jgi:hypothetical protein
MIRCRKGSGGRDDPAFTDEPAPTGTTPMRDQHQRPAAGIGIGRPQDAGNAVEGEGLFADTVDGVLRSEGKGGVHGVRAFRKSRAGTPPAARTTSADPRARPGVEPSAWCSVDRAHLLRLITCGRP